MKTIELLRGINPYPIPESVIVEIALKNGIDLEEEATADLVGNKNYQLAKADVYSYLSKAPNITQNGVSFTFTKEDKDYFLSISTSIKTEEGVEDYTTKSLYSGYVGEDL